MSSKQSKTTTAKSAANKAVPVASKTENKAPKSKSSKNITKKEIEVIVTPETETVVDETITNKTTKANKKEANNEAVKTLYDEIFTSIDAEVAALDDSTDKLVKKNVRFLRSMRKKLETLQKKSSTTKRKRTTPVTSANSGFLKPMNLSSEMTKFTGWEPNVPKSRVDVTKYICDYIKKNNLQNPEDRRQIVADPSLKKLLNFDPAKDGTLTYYKVQSFLKPHFIKPVDATASISA